MTQPNLASTFDTSCIDVNKSQGPHTTGNTAAPFSSTNTASSDEIATCLAQQTPTQPGVTRNRPTNEAHNARGSTSDTETQILQAVDDAELALLLPRFLEHVQRSRGAIESISPTPTHSLSKSPLNVVDIGCGTGRNTSKLLQYAWQKSVRITCLNPSASMLEITRRKCQRPLNAAVEMQKVISLEFAQWDLSNPSKGLEMPVAPGSVDAVISTLTLEYRPLPAFLSAMSSLLRSEGLALVTVMHPNMGTAAKAALVNENERRVETASLVHRVRESIASAKDARLEIVGEVIEGTVTAEILARNGEIGRRWLGLVVWFGIVVRKVSLVESY
ncbi:hypothetical protein LTR50_000392 [Elasticomyces elasticus]|nr:hypothetical protein LTR50_000392 [Elasticomyces elasticus]